MAKKMFKVRASKKGFGGVPPSRRVPNEVFRVAAGKDGKMPKAKWYAPVSESVPEARPERPAEEPQQYEKRDGDVVPVDRRSSAEAYTSPQEPDTSYLEKFADASPDVEDTGDDLT